MSLFPGYLVSPAPIGGGPKMQGTRRSTARRYRDSGNRFPDARSTKLQSRGILGPTEERTFGTDPSSRTGAGVTAAGLISAGLTPQDGPKQKWYPHGHFPWAGRRRTEFDVTDRLGQANTGLIPPPGLSITGMARSGLTLIGTTHVGLADKGLTTPDGQTQA